MAQSRLRPLLVTLGGGQPESALLTMLRGKIMVENGRMVGTQGTGQLIPRKIDSAMLTRPRL